MRLREQHGAKDPLEARSPKPVAASYHLLLSSKQQVHPDNLSWDTSHNRAAIDKLITDQVMGGFVHD
jgi:hypothetical protein